MHDKWHRKRSREFRYGAYLEIWAALPLDPDEIAADPNGHLLFVNYHEMTVLRATWADHRNEENKVRIRVFEDGVWVERLAAAYIEHIPPF